MNVEEWLKLNADWNDTVTFQGSAPDPKNPECEYGLWFFNQENKGEGYGRHFALRLKYLKKNREVIAWHLQIWNPWRKKQDHEGEADESDAPSTLPIVGPVEH